MAVAVVAALLAEHYRRVKALHRETRAALQDLRASQERTRSDLLRAHLADVGERVIGDAATDQDRCLRLAQWVAGHVSNVRNSNADVLATLGSRSGLCRTRADLFVEMAGQFAIQARVFNIYDFGGPASGHSCVQAWHDGGWHFYDVTYAGAFVRDGRVLSWDEVRADPESALAGLVAFPDTLDRAGGPQFGERVSNERRMRVLYTPQTIREATCFGFLQHPDVKRQEVRVAAADLATPLQLGVADGDGMDVDTDGRVRKLGLYLGSLGTLVDTFHRRWQFDGCEPGTRYVLRFHLGPASHPGLTFRARVTAAGTLDRYEHWVTTTGKTRGSGETWEVDFTPTAPGPCAVEIDHDFREPGRGVVVDRIEVFRAAP